jgi:hypothetical protein
MTACALIFASAILLASSPPLPSTWPQSKHSSLCQPQRRDPGGLSSTPPLRTSSASRAVSNPCTVERRSLPPSLPPSLLPSLTLHPQIRWLEPLLSVDYFTVDLTERRPAADDRLSRRRSSSSSSSGSSQRRRRTRSRSRSCGRYRSPSQSRERSRHRGRNDRNRQRRYFDSRTPSPSPPQRRPDPVPGARRRSREGRRS